MRSNKSVCPCWRASIYEIEAKLGGSAALYFYFLRWLLMLCLIVALVFVAIIILPAVGEFNSKGLDYAGLLIGAGMENSFIFFGGYKNEYSNGWKMDLAWVIVVTIALLFSLIYIILSLDSDQIVKPINPEDSSDQILKPFSVALFAGFDHSDFSKVGMRRQQDARSTEIDAILKIKSEQKNPLRTAKTRCCLACTSWYVFHTFRVGLCVCVCVRIYVCVRAFRVELSYHILRYLLPSMLLSVCINIQILETKTVYSKQKKPAQTHAHILHAHAHITVVRGWGFIFCFMLIAANGYGLWRVIQWEQDYVFEKFTNKFKFLIVPLIIAASKSLLPGLLRRVIAFEYGPQFPQTDRNSAYYCRLMLHRLMYIVLLVFSVFSKAGTNVSSATKLTAILGGFCEPCTAYAGKCSSYTGTDLELSASATNPVERTQYLSNFCACKETDAGVLIYRIVLCELIWSIFSSFIWPPFKVCMRRCRACCCGGPKGSAGVESDRLDLGPSATPTPAALHATPSRTTNIGGGGAGTAVEMTNIGSSAAQKYALSTGPRPPPPPPPGAVPPPHPPVGSHPSLLHYQNAPGRKYSAHGEVFHANPAAAYAGAGAPAAAAGPPHPPMGSPPPGQPRHMSFSHSGMAPPPSGSPTALQPAPLQMYPQQQHPNVPMGVPPPSVAGGPARMMQPQQFPPNYGRVPGPHPPAGPHPYAPSQYRPGAPQPPNMPNFVRFMPTNTAAGGSPPQGATTAAGGSPAGGFGRTATKPGAPHRMQTRHNSSATARTRTVSETGLFKRTLNVEAKNEFDPLRNIVDVIYVQMLVWSGMAYSPFLPVFALVALFIIFHIKLLEAHWFSRRPHHPSPVAFDNAMVRKSMIYAVLCAIAPVTYFLMQTTSCGPYFQTGNSDKNIAAWISLRVDSLPQGVTLLVEYLTNTVTLWMCIIVGSIYLVTIQRRVNLLDDSRRAVHALIVEYVDNRDKLIKDATKISASSELGKSLFTKWVEACGDLGKVYKRNISQMEPNLLKYISMSRVELKALMTNRLKIAATHTDSMINNMKKVFSDAMISSQRAKEII